MNINGGFPAGSVILLLEDVGAGAREFLYTSVFNILMLKEDRSTFNTLDKAHDGINEQEKISVLPALPGEICYISVSKSKQDIINETSYAFHEDFSDALRNKLVFKELSDIYFRHTIINKCWISGTKEMMDLEQGPDRNIIDELSGFLDGHAMNNIIILDSLTELMMYEADFLGKKDIMMFMKGIARASKTWNGLIYVVLGANILEPQIQEAITDTVDGVLEFQWSKTGMARHRSLYITKFRGLMPRLEQERIAKFETKITSNSGFEVSNVRKIV